MIAATGAGMACPGLSVSWRLVVKGRRCSLKSCEVGGGAKVMNSACMVARSKQR